ncbi:MAG TPA: hypothetical protein VM370_10480 [Candidatus Thermoplasmatota archaeon]|nr:hypothetical protein [Candidatus Thermoplasmatota archaeon]
MRATLLLAPLLLVAGCNGAPAAKEGWSYFASAGDSERALATAPAFNDSRALDASDGASVLRGAWDGPLEAAQPLTLAFNGSVPMRMEFSARDASGASTHGVCNWPADAQEEKPVGIARVLMRSTNETCEMRITPTLRLAADEGTFEWEARARDANATAWTLRVTAARG